MLEMPARYAASNNVSPQVVYRRVMSVHSKPRAPIRSQGSKCELQSGFSALNEDDLWAYLEKKSLHRPHPIPMWFECALNLPVALLAFGGWANEIT